MNEFNGIAVSLLIIHRYDGNVGSACNCERDRAAPSVYLDRATSDVKADRPETLTSFFNAVYTTERVCRQL